MILNAGKSGEGSSPGGGADVELDNLSNVNINTSLLAQTGTDLGSTTKPFRDLFLYGSGTYGTTYLRLTGTPTGTRVLTLPNETGNLVVQTVVAEQDLADGDITWDATPPSNPTARKYWSCQTGKDFRGDMRLEYGTAGAANTSLIINFPSGWPTPATITSWDNSEMGFTIFASLIQTAVTNNPITGVRAAVKKSAGGVNQVVVNFGTSSSILVAIQVRYTAT